MPAIRREIEVNAPPTVAATSWVHFVEWALNGPRRLACDELACIDATASGAVSFERAGDNTTVVFHIGGDERPGPSDEELERHVAHDLVLFKDYVERDAGRDATRSKGEKKALMVDDDRRRHHYDHESASEKAETVAYTRHFPT